MSIRVTDLDDVLIATRLGDRGIVEFFDDLLANFTRFEPLILLAYIFHLYSRVNQPSKTNTTAIATSISQDPSRANFMWRENSRQFLCSI